MNQERRERSVRSEELVIDNVLATQPELGPTIPDGGYGWFIFFASLFFQALIPSLIVSYGIFLVFSRLETGVAANSNPKLWDHKLLHVPLFFIATSTFVDPVTRSFISQSIWPRLVATAGTCLTCGGILFLWMAMTGYGSYSSLYILSGIVSGVGASIQIAQCDILMAQYFKFKHNILAHVTQAVTALGFVFAPIAVGHHVISSSLWTVTLWYQAIILQGLVLNLLFKKPLYLKSKPNKYNYVSTAPDDEEDIFSKNSRELQIKRQNGGHTQIEKHELPINNLPNNEQSAETSSQIDSKNLTDIEKKEQSSNWQTFEDDDVEETKYEQLKGWETFEEEEYLPNVGKPKNSKNDPSNWEKFDDAASNENQRHSRNSKNLRLELSFDVSNDSNSQNIRPSTSAISGLPLPLFSDLPVNNNNTYSYDALEDPMDRNHHQPAVFMPTTVGRRYSFSRLELLKQPTFYKSLITIITTKFSVFVYFSLFPSYLYQEIEYIKLRSIASLVGLLSLTSFLFTGISYWINIDKKRRAICLWFLCWVGTSGYFLISDYTGETMLLFGAVQITLSISALQYIGGPLMGLTLRGETSKEYALISVMTGASFLFFTVVNASFKDCFRLMALLNFFTGALWLSNFIYKKIFVR